MIVKAGLMTGQAFAAVRRCADRHGFRFIFGSVILQACFRTDDCRVGYIVSRKCGNAVHRNRIKRRLRSATAEAFSKTPNMTGDFVFIGRKRAYDCAYGDLLADIEGSLHRYNRARQL